MLPNFAHFPRFLAAASALSLAFLQRVRGHTGICIDLAPSQSRSGLSAVEWSDSGGHTCSWYAGWSAVWGCGLQAGW